MPTFRFSSWFHNNCILLLSKSGCKDTANYRYDKEFSQIIDIYENSFMYFTQRARLRLKSDANIWHFPVESLYHDHPDKQLHRMILLTCHRIFILAITGQDASYPQHRMKSRKTRLYLLGTMTRQVSVFPDIVSITI